MLLIDVSVNRLDYIGEIAVIRLDKVPESGNCRYKIVKPEGDWNRIIIKHNYYDGWFPLLEKVMTILKQFEFSTKRI